MRSSSWLATFLAVLAVRWAAAAQTAAELIAEARATARRGDGDRADSLLKQAEQGLPGEALMLRGNIAMHVRKDVEGGMALFRASIAADATRWDSHYFLGRALADQERWDEATASFAASAELDPTKLTVLLDLGKSQAASGGFEDAAATMLRAAALDVHSSQALLLLAQTAVQRSELESALRAYEDVTELLPWHAQPFLQLASLRVSLVASGVPERAAMAAAAAARPGAPSVCELRDAARALQPSIAVPEAVRRSCESGRLEGSKVVVPGREFDDDIAIRDREAVAAQAKAVAEGPCHFLAAFPSLASRASTTASEPSSSSGPACVVRLPAGRALRLRHAEGDRSGVLVPGGAHLTVEADGGAEGRRAVLDAGGASRLFVVGANATLTLRRVTLRGGRSLLSGGGALLLLPGATLDASECAFEANRAVLGSGGAIASRGATVRLHKVRFADNEATLRGGALCQTCTSEVMRATTTLEEVDWHANRAGRGGDDVMLCAGAALIPRPSSAACSLAESTEPAGSRAGADSAGEEPPDGLSAPTRLVLSGGSMSALECSNEALELLERKGLERDALRLLQHASAADPSSPNAFSFHLNFLYTHAKDSEAAALLEAFAAAVPDHPSLPASRAMLADASAPMLHQRGQTLNGQVARMRDPGAPLAVDFASRLQAQDAATSAFAQALRLSPASGDVWNDLGTSLFFAGELAESSLVYAAGVQRAPSHAALRAEAKRAAAFPLAPRSADQITVDLFGGGAPRSGGAPGGGTFASEFTAIPLPEGSYGSRPESVDLQAGAETFGERPRVFVSQRPLLPKPTCERYITAAEAWAARSGGWTTARHHSVATTDIPLTSLDELLPSFNEALRTLLLPALSACYPEAAPLASSLRVLDCFLVRYDATKQASLPTHTDQSLLSFTIALNDPGEYDGGGTWFRGLGRAVDAPAAGHAVLFPGKVEHGGHPITRGVRYIIVLFMGYETNRLSQRPAGYALEAAGDSFPAGSLLKEEL